MQLQTLYARTTTGAVQEWTIEIVDDKFRTHHGQVGGKITTTQWTTAQETNAGRANMRTASEQALFEAQALWKKKKDSGSFEDINDVDKQTFVEPMLAKKWEDFSDAISYPVYTQAKFDGARCVITKDGAFSRNGKPWKTVPHILKELKPLFEKYPDLVLDGELYNHTLRDDFNKIMSLVKKTKPTPADLAESEKTVQFWWYDIVDTEANFIDRNRRIGMLVVEGNLNSNVIVAVPTYTANDQDKVDTQYSWYIEEGFEGQIIRTNAKYQCKRTKDLLKRKDFQDAEYKIVEICEGNGNKTGLAGYAWMEREDGVRFRTNILGNHSFLRDLLTNAESYKDTYGTIKFFQLTPDGIPRFPYLTRLRAGVGID